MAEWYELSPDPARPAYLMTAPRKYLADHGQAHLKHITNPEREKTLAMAGLVCLGLLLFGHVLVYPPYEGFDETAHYSYISHLADEGAIPWIGVTRFDSTLARELDGLPRPYSTVPPLENNGGLTYRAFYQDLPNSARQRASRQFWSPRSAPARFSEDGTSAINDAASHPPLYYALMVPPYRMSASWSPGASLLLLRLLSICLVSASYWMFWCSVRLLDDPELRLRLLGGGLLAMHSASIVFEFGRIGNDSLVVLLFSIIFYLLVRLARNGMEDTRDFALLGFVLGLGLMTKLYFVASLAVALLAVGCLGYVRRVSLQPLLARMALLLGIAMLTGGWWYVLFKLRYGVFFGTHLTLGYNPPEATQRRCPDLS